MKTHPGRGEFSVRLHQALEIVEGRRTLLSEEWYQPLFMMLFGVTLIYSVLDLYLTQVGLSVGLSETNFLLLGVSRLSGLNLIDSLAMAKLAFVAGGAVVCAIGLRTKDAKLRTKALMLMIVLTILLLYAAANNVYWISVAFRGA